eukprot:gnl/Dysnectes_brevis/3048_a3775_1298.p1 GENE.gnl/Dysnectes_brevis/3048_a3775_1298~~gnl/Dysnectes_brevis/3048_a3775_1298.p1  ORF type:complete len:811 (-),score=137.99 gnl/Dysnectes_brevis/3048_a3775_1298:45-2477(-)
MTTRFLTILSLCLLVSSHSIISSKNDSNLNKDRSFTTISTSSLPSTHVFSKDTHSAPDNQFINRFLSPEDAFMFPDATFIENQLCPSFVGISINDIIITSTDFILSSPSFNISVILDLHPSNSNIDIKPINISVIFNTTANDQSESTLMFVLNDADDEFTIDIDSSKLTFTTPPNSFSISLIPDLQDWVCCGITTVLQPVVSFDTYVASTVAVSPLILQWGELALIEVLLFDTTNNNVTQQPPTIIRVDDIPHPTNQHRGVSTVQISTDSLCSNQVLPITLSDGTQIGELTTGGICPFLPSASLMPQQLDTRSPPRAIVILADHCGVKALPPAVTGQLFINNGVDEHSNILLGDCSVVAESLVCEGELLPVVGHDVQLLAVLKSELCFDEFNISSEVTVTSPLLTLPQYSSHTRQNTVLWIDTADPDVVSQYIQTQPLTMPYGAILHVDVLIDTVVDVETSVDGFVWTKVAEVGFGLNKTVSISTTAVDQLMIRLSTPDVDEQSTYDVIDNVLVRRASFTDSSVECDAGPVVNGHQIYCWATLTDSSDLTLQLGGSTVSLSPRGDGYYDAEFLLGSPDTGSLVPRLLSDNNITASIANPTLIMPGPPNANTTRLLIPPLVATGDVTVIDVVLLDIGGAFANTSGCDVSLRTGRDGLPMACAGSTCSVSILMYSGDIDVFTLEVGGCAVFEITVEIDIRLGLSLWLVSLIIIGCLAFYWFISTACASNRGIIYSTPRDGPRQRPAPRHPLPGILDSALSLGSQQSFISRLFGGHSHQGTSNLSMMRQDEMPHSSTLSDSGLPLDDSANGNP